MREEYSTGTAISSVTAGLSGKKGPGRGHSFAALRQRPVRSVESGKSQRRGHPFTVWAAAALLAAGIGLLAYPTVSDLWNRSLATGEIVSYIETIEQMEEDTQEQMRVSAEAYNRRLYEEGTGSLELTDEEYALYRAELDVTGTGIMCYLEIPSIDVCLPVYHGTEESVLQIAVGHVEGTSLPIGGESTHAVVSGHTGLQSARLLTDLDQVQIGDVFYLYTLGQTLTYEVDQILVVLPEEVEALAIQEGEDLVTIVTCTPYGINTHRLLVRGHRVEDAASDITVTMFTGGEEALAMGTLLTGLAAAAAALALLTLLLAIAIGK